MRVPCGRSSAWRDHFPTPTNYNDNQLNCGGFSVSSYRNMPNKGAGRDSKAQSDDIG